MLLLHVVTKEPVELMAYVNVLKGKKELIALKKICQLLQVHIDNLRDEGFCYSIRIL